MLDLWFLTTNQVKLSHFRHLARGSGVVINSFHEKTYFGSYAEPKIGNRDHLLKASYDSALRQWRKKGLSEELFFFLEDTSLVIYPLSDAIEFPGTDVKYWMSETSFSDLDAELRLKGRGRRVVVRSDIILHLPPSIRAAYGNGRDYLQFTGIAEGEVISKEIPVTSNPLRPWQDSKSFNKWFVPDGENVPYSLLTPEAEEKHDFRRKAFKSLIDFLKDAGFHLDKKETRSRQLSLPGVGNESPLLIVCGPSGAGKTTLAEYLMERFGYMHFEASDFMRLAYHERLGRDAEIQVSEFAAAVLKNEPWTIPESVVQYIDRFSGHPVVVTGFRSPKEVQYLCDYFEGKGEISVLFLDAPRKIRFLRVNKRNRDGVTLSYMEMCRRDNEQRKMGLYDIKSIPRAELLKNKETKKEFYSACTRRLFSGDQEFHASGGRALFRGAQMLERAIILALGGQKGRVGYTTAAIARLINESGSRGFKTEKDNVSRFFNQKFSPFFTMNVVNDRAKYSLSQTGRSLYFSIVGSKNRVIFRHRPEHKVVMQLGLFD